MLPPRITLRIPAPPRRKHASDSKNAPNPRPDVPVRTCKFPLVSRLTAFFVAYRFRSRISVSFFFDRKKNDPTSFSKLFFPLRSLTELPIFREKLFYILIPTLSSSFSFFFESSSDLECKNKIGNKKRGKKRKRPGDIYLDISAREYICK